MMQEERVEITETNATRLAEFLSSGDWRYHSHFALLGRVYQDGFGDWRPVPPSFQGGDEQGEVYGKPVGELFHCFKCGADIQYHYAIQDRKTKRIVNLGMECIERFLESGSKELAKIKGLESLKRKIVTDTKRKIHHDQIVEFMKSNLDVLAEKRRKAVANNLKKNPEYYWKSKTHIVETKTGRIELTRTKWERTVDAEKDMNDELFYWEYFIQKYEVRYWNPKTMKPEIQKMVDAEDVGLQVPQFRKMTDAEKKSMYERIFKEVAEYEKRIAE